MTPSRNHRQAWLIGAGLALVTLALYWPVRHYDFVQYDDDVYVFNNPTVRAGLSWWGLVWSVVDAHASNWHPLTWWSHMLDCQLFGLNAGAQHLVNVVFHCANTVLLFLLLRSLTGAMWRSGFVAALFAWHPLHVESVAWISERKDVLSGFFFMLTLWAYVPYARAAAAVEREKVSTSAPRRPRAVYYRLSLICFALGLLSKPMVVTVPLVLLLMDYWPLNRIQPWDRSQPGARFGIFGAGVPRGLLLEKIPFFAAAVVLSVITLWAQNYGHSVASFKTVGVLARIEDTLTGYLGYLEKLFWPRDLSVLYLRPAAEPLGLVLLAVLVLLGISALAAVNLRLRPYLLVGWLWYLVVLVPVIGLVPVGLQSIADRYSYLPSIGLFIMLAWGVEDLLSGKFPGRAWQPALAVVAVAVLSTCVALARHQLGYWKNTQTLMEHALKIDPDNYIAHDDLGVYFSKIGRTKDALFHYQRYRELAPEFAGSGASAVETNATDQAPTNRVSNQ